MLEHCVEEHRRAVAAADFNSSALAEHAWEKGHLVGWDNIKMLSVAHDFKTHIIWEAFTICTSCNVLNRDGGALPREYENLVSGHRGFILLIIGSFHPLPACMPKSVVILRNSMSTPPFRIHAIFLSCHISLMKNAV